MLSRVGQFASHLRPGRDTIVAAGPGDVATGSGIHMPARGGLPPRAFRQIREYILAHLTEKIGNPELAGLAGLSASHFSRAFKQSAGMSPHRFVLESRIGRVKQLLVETELPLAQIAINTGFGDHAHCSRWFRKLVGITPSRYRWLSR